MFVVKEVFVKVFIGGIEIYLFKKNGIDYIKGEVFFEIVNKFSVKFLEGGEI